MNFNLEELSYTNPNAHSIFQRGAKSRQAEIDELQRKLKLSESLRDNQFEKLWGLTQALEVARNGADEDFDLFLNHLSNILKGNNHD